MPKPKTKKTQATSSGPRAYIFAAESDSHVHSPFPEGHFPRECQVPATAWLANPPKWVDIQTPEWSLLSDLLRKPQLNGSQMSEWEGRRPAADQERAVGEAQVYPRASSLVYLDGMLQVNKNNSISTG